MITIGITGGIGSGKTTVCKVWEELGAYVLNADDLAKNIMIRNSEVRAQIQEQFGEESYREDGSLNRAYLAEEAFGKNRVEELNAIVHPRIPAEFRTVMDRERNNGCEVFVYEAALLLHDHRPGVLDYIVLVLADREKRVERVTARDDSQDIQVKERMAKQQDFNKLVHLADFIIYNNGSLSELRIKAVQVYREIYGKKYANEE